MTLIQTTPPGIEPITLAEAKAHLRIDTTAEDLLITTLITAARQHLERAFALALVTQSWSLFLDAWPPPPQPVTLPLAPILQLTAVRMYAPDDTPTTLPLAEFQLDRGTPARVIKRSGALIATSLRPLAAIEVAFTAGFGATPASVPSPIRQALLHLLAHLHMHREAEAALPSHIAQLLAPWHGPRLQ